MSNTLASPLVLGIETSCDDTAGAVIDGRGRVLASVVSSQLAVHRPYGGVVPEIASREHLGNWPAVSREVLARADVGLDEIDAVAATRGPGLVGCLLVGLSLGRAIAWARKCSFHAVHHLEGHLYSPFLAPPDADPETADAAKIPERFTGLVISGGHTSLLDVDHGRVQSLVETRDDAMGEVFDKVGKRIGLGYPQGPQVDQLAEGREKEARAEGETTRYRFKVPPVRDELFFSYSGLKSQALREIEKLERAGLMTDDPMADDPMTGPDDPMTGTDLSVEALDLLVDFRRAAVRQVLNRLGRQHAIQPLTTLAVSGGVAANRLLRRELTTWAAEHDVDLRLVPLVYSGDNAAMIAFAALLRQRQGISDDPRRAVVASRIPFEPMISGELTISGR